jgi:hypothetical protein
MVAIWLAGFLIAGFLPLPAPSANAHTVAGMYAEDRLSIRFGLVLTVACSGLLAPFIGVISAQLKRIEGPHSPLTYAQIALGALLIIEFVYPMMILQVAAYRGERSDEAVQLLNDLGWILFVGVVCTAIMQMLVIAVVILQDQRPTPIFPRWAGYLNIWSALLITASSVIPFFKTGPFAWNGLVAWWIAVTAFAIWLFVMAYLLIKAINRQETESNQSDEEAEPATRAEVDQLRRELADVRAALSRISAATAAS